jgi:hypothetical protein
METQNSLLDFYIEVYMHLHSDVAGAYASTGNVEYVRDRREIANRARSEGLGFFTKSLPKLGKALDRALSSGERLQCSGFKLKRGTQLPEFFGTLFRCIFDETGRERSDACPMVLGQLRQLLFVLYKLKLPYDEETAARTVQQFAEVDASLDWHPDSLDEGTTSILQTARGIIFRVLSGLCSRDICPSHGPGAVATGEVGVEKRVFTQLDDSIETWYPFTEYFRFNLTHVADTVQDIQSLKSVKAGTAKVVLVPKDSRGPRIISCEPLSNQWIQQGQKDVIVRRLESHNLTRGQVNFTDQTVNRDLAMSGSLGGTTCTLDMKEASDRVSLNLVACLFPRDWLEALLASRSYDTRLPNGTVIRLKKFAPMGSAVCFPVEAFIFWALTVSIVMHTRGLSLARARRTVYVYGDDIICSCDDQAAIRQLLPKFGLLLNEDKCCTARFFRESCGCDAYKGVDVTPLRISAVWCSHLRAGPYDSYVAYSNAAYLRGYYALSEFLENRIQKIRPTPYTNGDLPQGISFVRAHVIARKQNRVASIPTRFNLKLQRWEALGWRNRPTYKKYASSGWDELLRVVSNQQSWDPFREEREQHLLPSVPSTERWYVAARAAQLRGATFLEIKEALCGQTQTLGLKAGIYAVPHRNRLQKGWIPVT